MSEPTRSAFGFTAKERLEYEQTLLRLLVASMIERYIQATGIQAQEIATRMGKSKAWVSKLLSGRHNPTLDTLAELALALGLRWDVQLSTVDRAGTPAEHDPDPPAWTMSQPTTVFATTGTVTFNLVDPGQVRAAPNVGSAFWPGWMVVSNMPSTSPSTDNYTFFHAGNYTLHSVAAEEMATTRDMVAGSELMKILMVGQ